MFQKYAVDVQKVRAAHFPKDRNLSAKRAVIVQVLTSVSLYCVRKLQEIGAVLLGYFMDEAEYIPFLHTLSTCTFVSSLYTMAPFTVSRYR